MNGIVSAADEKFFLGAAYLFKSIRGQASFLLWDLGLTDLQRSRCGDLGIEHRVPPRLPISRAEEMWQSWNKPWLIYDSPFDVTLWIDADCLVLGDLGPLFDVAKAQPLICAHPDGVNYCNPNRDELFLAFPVKNRLRPDQSINAGIMGFAKADRDLMETWMWAVNNPALRRLINWHDEGCLHWALGKIDGGHLIQYRPEWNRFEWFSTTQSPEEFFRSMNLPDTTIVHNAGRIKYWFGWDRT